MGISTPKSASPEGADAERGLPVGTVVSDRYRVVHAIGEGAMGAVYRVEHLHMRKPFALKVLHQSVSSNAQVVARFEREAIVAGNIGHPNVAAATDFGRLADGSFFLIMEFVDGRSLRDELDKGPLPFARALMIMRGILAGVGAAHAKGIVHRDLKPENVMLTLRDGDPDFVKVLDFGIARFDLSAETKRESGVQPLTQVGVVMGTPDYMAPEQAVGGAVDARSDLYSLGVIFFEMLTGRRPFQGGVITVLRSHVLDEAPSLPPELLATIDPRVAGVIGMLMAKQPEQRFQTAHEVSATLEEIALPVSAEVPLHEAPTVPPPAPSSTTLTEGRGPAALVHRAATGLRARFPAPLATWPQARLERAVVGAVLAAAALVVLALVLLAGGGADRSTATRAGPVPTGSGARAAPTASAPAAATVPSVLAPADPLPPFAPPSRASAARSTPSPSASSHAATPAGRRTGPGGIYIPPPKDWFR